MSVLRKLLEDLGSVGFKPVLKPSQNGDDVENASTWGRKYRAAFIICIRRSRSAMPTWTCTPKIRRLLATIWSSSIEQFVTVVLEDLLFGPLRKRMRGSGNDLQPLRLPARR